MAIYDKLGTAVGLDIYCSQRLEGVLKNAGFTDVQAIRVTVPLGPWNGQLSERVGQIRGLKTPVLRNGGFGIVQDEQEYDKLTDAMEEEWERPGTSNSFIGKKDIK